MPNTIFFPSSARLFCESRMLFMALETQPAPESHKSNEQPKKSPETRPNVNDKGKKEIEKDVNEGLTTPKKDKESILRDKLTKLLKAEFKKENVEVTSEEVKKALRYYGLGKHKGGKADNKKMETILDKIKYLQENGVLKAEGIRLNYVGGTDATGYRLPLSMKWHTEKLKTFTLFKEFPTDRIKISGNVKPDMDLINKYMAAVESGKIKNIINLVFRKKSIQRAFLKGGGLFDIALAVQRADDMKMKMEGSSLDGKKDYLYLELGSTKGSVKERKSGLRLSGESEFITNLRDKKLDKKLAEQKEKAPTAPEDKMLELDGTEKRIEPEKEQPAPVVKPAPATKPAPTPKLNEKERAAAELAEKVKNEKNNIIPRDYKENSNADAQYGFDAAKIPDSINTFINGQNFNTATVEGRNKLARYNVYNAARTAAIRAKILENTGALPEAIKNNADRRQAELIAEQALQLENWQLSQEVLKKYFIEEKSKILKVGGPGVAEKILKGKATDARKLVEAMRADRAEKERKATAEAKQEKREEKKPESPVKDIDSAVSPDPELIDDAEYPKIQFIALKGDKYGIKVQLNDESKTTTYDIKVPSGFSADNLLKNIQISKGEEKHGYFEITTDENDKLKIEVHGKINVVLKGTTIEVEEKK